MAAIHQLPEEAGLLSHLLGWIGVLYRDSMDAKFWSDRQVSKVRNISMDDLLTVVDKMDAVIRP